MFDLICLCYIHDISLKKGGHMHGVLEGLFCFIFVVFLVVGLCCWSRLCCMREAFSAKGTKARGELWARHCRAPASASQTQTCYYHKMINSLEEIFWGINNNFDNAIHYCGISINSRLNLQIRQSRKFSPRCSWSPPRVLKGTQLQEESSWFQTISIFRFWLWR